ncbi:hypothetical protein AB0B50_04235 [Streptomyces sp. NPDC041068]|uniref:hypothetical protein n=1 Tax=Streptomyces sp. NPDC041068 TaxID=3155130 RepID=UPI0033D6189A
MPTTTTIVDAYEALGALAPECGMCEGSGMVTFLLGPYEHSRECDQCHGVGRYLACPHCTDGVAPSGDTCRTCEGFTALV